jgi:tetratricopeptide (TPR) repeat protein
MHGIAGAPLRQAKLGPRVGDRYALRHGLVHLVATGERAGLSRWLANPWFARRFLGASEDEPSLFVRLWRVQGDPDPSARYAAWKDRADVGAEMLLLAGACVGKCGGAVEHKAAVLAALERMADRLSEQQRARARVLGIGVSGEGRRAVARQIVEQIDAVLGWDAGHVGGARRLGVAMRLQLSGDLTGATKAYDELIRDPAALPDIRRTAFSRLVSASVERRDATPALALVETIAPLMTSDPAVVADFQLHVAMALRTARRRGEAVERLHLAHASALTAFGPRHPETIDVLNLLGVCLAESGRPADAEPWLRSAYDRRAELFGAGAAKTIEAGRNLAAALKLLGRTEEALALYKSALAGTKARKDATRNDLVRARVPVAECLHALGRYAEEVRVRRRIVASVKDGLSKGAPSSWRSLERALRAARLAGDAEWFRELTDAHLPQGAASIPAGLPEAHARDLVDVLS